MIREPESLLKKLFAFLEVEDESVSLLKGYAEARGGISLTNAPIGNWKSQFTGQEKLKFRELAGDLLADLGYAKHEG